MVRKKTIKIKKIKSTPDEERPKPMPAAQAYPDHNQAGLGGVNLIQTVTINQ
jgi:hypothetical protein